MKRLFLFLACAFALSACGSSGDVVDPDIDPNNPNNPSQPPVGKDVCSYIEDDYFRQYCYDHFDVNGDGNISETEALAVTTLDLQSTNITTLNGIEYFPNLERLNCRLCKQLSEVDLSKNQKITSIDTRAFDYCESLMSVTMYIATEN